MGRLRRTGPGPGPGPVCHERRSGPALAPRRGTACHLWDRRQPCGRQPCELQPGRLLLVGLRSDGRLPRRSSPRGLAFRRPPVAALAPLALAAARRGTPAHTPAHTSTPYDSCRCRHGGCLLRGRHRAAAGAASHATSHAASHATSHAATSHAAAVASAAVAFAFDVRVCPRPARRRRRSRRRRRRRRRRRSRRRLLLERLRWTNGEQCGRQWGRQRGRQWGRQWGRRGLGQLGQLRLFEHATHGRRGSGGWVGGGTCGRLGREVCAWLFRCGRGAQGEATA